MRLHQISIAGLVAIFAWTFFASSLATAQTTQNRLSDWLVSRPYSPNAYPLGLSLRIPEEVPVQRTLQLNLLKSLSGGERDFSADSSGVTRLAALVRSLPVTGRIPVAYADARWLQANPNRDPYLLPGYNVVLPVRPRTVTVVRNTGELCQVIHSADREARAYLEACETAGSVRADWAWIAQPDGRIQRSGIALWNQNKQDEPAPGAWIWAPGRGQGWPEPFSERLITFLATQGPAPDFGDAAAVTLDRKSTANGSSSMPLPLAGLPSVTNLSLPVDGNPNPQAEGKITQLSTTPSSRSRDAQVSSSNWGITGLLQTPTARMQQVGNFTFSASRVYPYTRGNVILQPLDWLEAGFRYTNISNRLYGPESLSGSQAYKDKSFDFKARVWEESAYLPQVSIGVQDLTGTGLFSSEYIVGSKRTGSFDWSLGMGWGYLGARGDIRNPFSRFSTGFDTRTNTVGEGGAFSFGSYFHGPAAFFGGVQFNSPWEPLTLKLEYDGNNYKNEPQGNNLPQKSPWNLGAVYRMGSIVDLSVGFERGNTVMFGFTLHSPLDKLYMPKLNDPPAVPVAAGRSQRTADWAATSRDIQAQSDWHVREIRQNGRDLDVLLDDAAAVYMRERVDRVASVLHRDAPPSVDRFNLTYRQSGIEVAEHTIDRDAWVEEKTQILVPRRQRDPVIAGPAVASLEKGVTPAYADALPRFESGLGTNFQQTLGGPDGFILFQFGVTERIKYRIRDDTWIQGYAQLGLIDNYAKFKYTAPSNLPRVRTYLREFLTSAPLTLPNLQLTHVGKWGDNQYYSLYGGYLESMFAGAGGEWLYRPFGSRTAFGIDVNAVQQRDFHQDFSFKNAGDQTGYRVATGHATLYWDTGWNGVQANLSAGRYLAKDLGVTVQVAKVFQNSVAIGAFFSKTNVSTAQFGEGSFDKGIYVSIPFDAFLTKSSNSVGHFVWKPLTRDGGAKLARSFSLYDFTSLRDGRTLDFKLAPKPEEMAIPEERADYVPISRVRSEPYTLVTPRATAAQWASDSVRYEQQVAEALHKQGFRNIQVSLDASQRINLRLSNEQIRPISRAVGRAARTALRLSPLDVREIRVEYMDNNAPQVIYEFVDLTKLGRYLDGAINQSDVEPTIAISYINPGVRQANPLDQLADLDTRVYERSLVDVLLPAAQTSRRVVSDMSAAGRVLADTNWVKAGLLGTGLVLASSLLDNRADQFVKDHASNRWLKGLNTVGNALPWFAIAGAAALTLDESDPVRARTAYAATEAGGAAFLAVTGLKYVVGRARPGNDVGGRAFKPFSSASGYDSFPSGHAIVSWAVLTPFAEEYDAPWLYGVAAVTNLARVGSRLHWVSDTVAGSLLGYAIGKTFWAAGKESAKGSPRVVIGPQSIGLAWALK